MNPIQEFLELEQLMLNMNNVTPRGRGYRSLGEFVLKNGMEFKPRPLPKDIRRGVFKHCFMNATRLANSGRGLIYCEGYASGVIPVMHAWCCDEEGNVIDNTWVEPHCRPGEAYYGIAFDKRYLNRSLLKYETYGLIDQWTERFPILSQPPEMWRHSIMDQLKERIAA